MCNNNTLSIGLHRTSQWSHNYHFAILLHNEICVASRCEMKSSKRFASCSTNKSIRGFLKEMSARSYDSSGWLAKLQEEWFSNINFNHGKCDININKTVPPSPLYTKLSYIITAKGMPRSVERKPSEDEEEAKKAKSAQKPQNIIILFFGARNLKWEGKERKKIKKIVDSTPSRQKAHAKKRERETNEIL